MNKRIDESNLVVNLMINLLSNTKTEVALPCLDISIIWHAGVGGENAAPNKKESIENREESKKLATKINPTLPKPQ